MYQLIHGGGRRYGNKWAEQYALMFFMFYDAGQAAAMANAMTELDFWHMINYGYDHFKRGTERRHFRGQKGKDAMLKFQRMGSPRTIWAKMASRPDISVPDALTYTQLCRNLRDDFAGCQIGPYFMWKAMDILERCLGYSVTLSLKETLEGMPDEPKKCALTVWPDRPLSDTVRDVHDMIADLPAPGIPNRYCGYSEVETILCMIKGFFLTKTHRLGDDIDEKHQQLIAAGHPYLCDLLPAKITPDQRKNYERILGAA